MPSSLELEKELKVRIPHRLVVKLHSLKILQGQPIRETLVAALDAYYARPDVHEALRGAGDARRAEP